MVRKVDEFDEGIQPIKYRTSAPVQVPYKTSVQKDWYLIYKTVKPLSTTDLNNPLQCYLCANDRLLYSSATGPYTITRSYIGSYYIYFTKADNPNLTFKLGTATFSWSASSQGQPVAYMLNVTNNTVTVTGVYYNSSTESYNTYNWSNYAYDVSVTNGSKYRRNINRTLDINVISTYQSFEFSANTGTYVESINFIDRTDSSIMKIIKLPYPPCDVYYSTTYSFDSTKFIYDYDMHMMKAVSLDTEFLSTLTNINLSNDLSYTVSNTGYNKAKDINLESKLYNSAFFTEKFMYDQFSKEILLERWNKNATGSQLALNNVIFKPSNNIQSKFLFKITSSNYNEIDDYSEYMTIDRNNEVSLFNNDYLNYMRTGYNYDIAEKNRRNTASWLTTGIGIAAGIAGVAAGAFTGGVSAAAGISLLASSVTSAVSNINQSIQAESAIANKREQLAAQSGSVTASDINLMTYYTTNRLQKVSYKPTEVIRKQIYNLFYLTGYKDNTYAKPEFYTRIYFDFLQCVPDFKKADWKYPMVYLDDITARLETGITIFHAHNGQYDFEQQYENYERWLV